MLDSGRSARRRFSTSARFHVSTPPSFLKQHAKDARWRSLLFMLFLSCTLFVTVLNGWPASSALAFGFSYIHSTKPTFTLAQFLKEGQAVKAPRGPFVLPQKVSPVPGATKVPKVNLAKLPPNAEPANMKPIHQTLSLAFLHGGANVQPLDLKGSDGRLEVQLAPGTFDLSHALNAKGKSFQGSLILSLTQVHGHFVTSISVLGRYQLTLTDIQGHTVTGIRLHAPITILYHYQPWEMTDLGLDPGHLVLSWPAQLYAARQQHTALPGGIVALHDNAKTHTLTGKMIAFMPGAFDVGGGQVNQSPPVPHMASTMGNSGQFSYSYPLQLPPGPAGLTPPLALTYSSSQPNEQHSPTAPAGDVGIGWTLGLGAVTAVTYPSGSGSPGTWYFLSGVGNVSDRLVQSSQDASGTYFVTEHLSYLHIEMLKSCEHTGQPCFEVLDKSGVYYAFGDTPDTLQYQTNSDGTQQIYRWDVRLVIPPHEGTSTPYTYYNASYLQDCVPYYNPCPTYGTKNAAGVTIRDAVPKQITYGTANGTTQTSGTVDFSYLAPFTNSPWATAYNYGVNYNCAPGTSPPTTTTLRCDDPLSLTYNGITMDAPSVMSTFSLQTVTTYVGSDNSGSKDASYSFSYSDTPFVQKWDEYTQYQEYYADVHQLNQVTPTIYLDGNAHQLKPLVLSYHTEANRYYDSYHKEANNQYYISGQTYWPFLTAYVDANTGIGGSISYMEAHNNSHGTPNFPSDNNPTDARTDPLYCDIHQNTSYACTGNYQNPDDQVWSVEVVTQLATWGTDSSDGKLSPAVTQFQYLLNYTESSYQPVYPYFCYPAGTNSQCVGDDYIPSSSGHTQDSDWQDYYHAEFRGFQSVFTIDPANNLTQDQYFSTDGWNTAADSLGNYAAGHVYEEDRYSGDVAQSANLLGQTLDIVTGDWYDHGSTPNPCHGSFNPTYVPCLVAPLSTKTFDVEEQSANLPWVETDYTYDDYAKNTGLVGGKVYHNLTKSVTSSSNGMSFQRQWSYATTDTTVGSDTYYTVDTVSHSELDTLNSDGSIKHVWQCQDITYDEKAPSGVPTPQAGWPTTLKAYSDCTNPGGTALTSYVGYDVYGHPIASVDPVGTANSGFYSSQGLPNKNGCAFAQSALPPAYLSTNWSAGRFTTCAIYDTPYEAQLASSSNAFGQTTAMSYDYNKGATLSGVTDPNGQTSSYSYSYDGNSASNDKGYVGLSEPGESGSFTSQSNTYSFCASSIPGGITHPCYEINGTSATYPNLVSSTFYDSLGRAVETSVPGPTPPSPQSGMSYFTVTMTVHNDQANSVWQSLPFVVAVPTNTGGPTSTGWLDPNTATDYTGAAPGGTATFFDALGRVVATQDPLWNSSQEPGITCPNLLATTTYTDCTFYGLGNALGDSALYSFVGHLDPNNHVTVSLANMYGWSLYTQHYSGTYSGSGGIGGISGNLVEQVAAQDNVLGEPLSITTTDEKPQTGETASVTVSAHYDDLGRATDSSDPETGSFTYTYDPDGRLLTTVSGSRTLGSNYDLLGRIGCVQTAAPTLDADGSCTSGTSPLLQYVYDTDALGSAGSTDFPYGRLTKTIATTSYPDSGTPTASAITKYQYDTRGRIITTQLKFNLPSGWGVSSLPTYQAATSYNDADQATSISTSTIVNNTPTPQFTDAPIYDQNTGILTGLGTDGTGSPTLGTLAYTPTAQVGTVTFLSAGGAALVNEQYSYDGTRA